MTATPSVESNKIYISERLGFTDFEECLAFPKFIEVETIRACNAKCTFCSVYNGSFDAKPKKMSDRLLDKLIDELNRPEANTSTVCACRDGEPLLDRRIPGFIRSLKDAAIPTTTLVTNAELLNEKKALELLASGLDELMISIDGYTEPIYSKLRIGLDFDKVIANTIDFIALRDSLDSPMSLRIRMVVVDENRHEVDQYLDFWSDKVRRGDRVQALPAHSWGNELFIESKNAVERLSLKPCIAPFNMFTIHYDGEVTMCGHDYRHNHVVGDFNEESIKEIWNGERFERIRRQHLTPGRRNEIDACRGCQIWDRAEVGGG